MANPLLGPLLVWLGKLSFPRLFVAAATLFTINLFLPDPVPFVDELLLGLGALLLANFKRRRTRDGNAAIDGEGPAA